MDGVPVYLASLSHYSPLTRNTVLYPRWPKPWQKQAPVLLRQAVGEMGDETRERLFRMNLTVCLHRALREDELARLPPSFWEGEPRAIAGAPVEVLWESVPGSPSTQPCADPVRIPLPNHEGDPLYGWIPQDCGRCATCLARAA